MLIVAGDHVPVILFVEVVGRAGGVAFWHNGPIAAKFGTTLGVTVTLSVWVVAHSPAVGVKTYEPLVVLLITAGLHVPVIPLGDVVPSNGAVVPAQKAGIAAKSGTTLGVTVTLSVWVVAQRPAVGVKTYEPLVVLLITAGLHVPVIPLGDVVPSNGAVVPAQKAGIAAKFGTTLGVTVTLSVWVVAHSPAVGVKTYEPLVVLLITAGLHVPVIPFGDVVPSNGAVVPAQKAGIAAKFGTTLGVTVTLSVWVVAHSPAVGVKTYEPLVVLLITAGLHVPVIPFGDVVPSNGAVVPAQKAGIAAKSGTTLGVTVTLSVWVVAHSPAVGVKTYEPLVVLLITAGLHVPVIPFGDVVPSNGAVVPAQKAGIAAKFGTTLGVTVTLSVWVVAHSPAVGVKTYEPLVVLLITAGLHVPVIPFGDVVPSNGAVVPAQKAGIAAKSGTTLGVTVTLSVWVVAHSPAVGVKTYEPLVVLLITAGLHVPVIPFGDVVPSNGAVVPAQKAGIAAKFGTTLGVTVTLSVWVVAHSPAVGVKTYEPLVVLLITAGLHVPVIPFGDVVPSNGAVVPAQKAGIAAKSGTTLGVTVTFSVWVVAHSPAVGVKTYEPLVVLFITAGLHVPVIPFGDVVPSNGAVVPAQNAGIAAKSGTTLGVTVTLSVWVVAHSPAVGVKTYEPLVVLLITAGLHVPVIPFGDVVPSNGAVVPAQKAGIAAKSGTTLGVTVTLSVWVVAHSPAVGVKTYEPLVVLLITAGLHVPVIPFGDVVPSNGAVVPAQKAGIAAKFGTTLGVTVTLSVWVVAHSPAVGVKTYEPLVVLLITAGLHVPVIPLGDVNGNVGAIAPLHIADIGSNVGVMFALTATVKILAALVPHPLVAVTVIVPPAFPDVTVIDVVDCPAVMVQSAGTVHVYEVAVGTAVIL